MRSERGEQVVNRESGSVGISQDARDEGAQPALVITRGMCLRRCRADEGANPSSGLDDAPALELGVDPGDGVRIDAELDGKLTHGGKLVAGAEPARGDGSPEAPLELRVNRGLVAGIDGDDVHAPYYTS